ncbi:ATPase, T2SS/T4P/T4SS family [Pseudomonas sp. RP23018S]|uniref:ATPase, T2SS/T4P/T4SS family n=1 Tax=Pseudomonas sp. RP23018S TaxID=3096037 RepID=UPI002ACA5E0D|nr:ATPase, T2SS/T4P/T4SS family [Pseudomonas sp. RP23018S]MDZ5605245.1 ATPase, T2SS/T4P/T4SS family [Pseudomonas sp. RP23018S]
MDKVTSHAEAAEGRREGVVESLVANTVLQAPPFPMPAKIDLDYLDKLLAYCVEKKVSDLIIVTDDTIVMKTGASLYRFGERPFYLSEVEGLLAEMVRDPNAPLEVSRAEPRDFAYVLERVVTRPVRIRACATACLGRNGSSGLELIFRPTGKPIPPLDALEVEDYIKDNSEPDSGIVIVTGPTGSGKTTLLDSILMRNLTRYPAKRIVTYYAPIENDLNNIPGRVGQAVQSEIGIPGQGAHLKDFALAVRNMLRRNPDQVVFGEARDRPTIAGAVLAAMSAHTTYTTSHTSNVHMTIARMVDEFPADERIRMTNALIDNCRLIVHQRLVRHKDGIGVVAIRSALAFTQSIRNELLRCDIEKVPLLIKEATEREGISLLESAKRQFELGNIDEATLGSLEREMKAEIF